MGKKQQELLKEKQALIIYSIYCVPETFDVIQRIIQEVHSRDYVQICKYQKGKYQGKALRFEAMGNPQLMFPKYLYILHYLIRRKLQFSKVYNRFGYHLSSREMRKRICVDDSMMSLMLDLLQSENYRLIEKTMGHSRRDKKAAMYRLAKEVEAKVDSDSKFTLNRKDHGKMVEKLIQYGEEGKTYSEGKKAEQEQLRESGYEAIDESNKVEPKQPEEKRQQEIKKSPEVITEEFAIKYFKGLREARISPERTYLGDIERAIRNRMVENPGLPENKRAQLLRFLPAYIKSIAPPVDDILKNLHQRIYTIYPKRLMHAMLMAKVKSQNLPDELKEELVQLIPAFLAQKHSENN